MPGARAHPSVRRSPWGWGLSLAPPGGLGGGARTAEGWGKARVPELRPLSPGIDEAGRALGRDNVEPEVSGGRQLES